MQKNKFIQKREKKQREREKKREKKNVKKCKKTKYFIKNIKNKVLIISNIL